MGTPNVVVVGVFGFAVFGFAVFGFLLQLMSEGVKSRHV
jgi:hypothetical protein